MKKPIYFTICSKNYMAYALTLGKSLVASDPAAEFKIFLADTPLSQEQSQLVPFDVISVDKLGIENFKDLIIRYSIMELNTAIKPACFLYLFNEHKCDAAVYLDPDIYIIRSLSHVEAQIIEGSNVILTPHSLSPLDDGADPDDLRLLRTGSYNLGFVAFKRSDETLRFLKWWGRQLKTKCIISLDKGIFVDQKWMDLAPSYLSGAYILRHPGYNVAYWNLLGRDIRRSHEGEWSSNENLLYFFHFSGVVPGNSSVFSKHQNRYQVENIGVVKNLLEKYLYLLEQNDHNYWNKQRYGFSLDIKCGVSEQVVRAVYRRKYDVVRAGSDLQINKLEKLCMATCSQLPGERGETISNAAFEIWAMREDLREKFDLNTSEGRVSFLNWMRVSGVKEGYFSSEFSIPSVQVESSSAPKLKVTSIAVLRLAMKLKKHFGWLINIVPTSWTDSMKKWLQGIANHKQYSKILTNIDDLPMSDLAIFGYFNTESGLGQAVRNEYKAICSAGMSAEARIVPLPTVFEDTLQFSHLSEHQESIARIHLLHFNADQVIALQDTEHSQELFSDRHYRIGYWAWELDVFPSQWNEAFNFLDEIWVPSQFVADSISEKTEKPIYVFPHSIEFVETNISQQEVRKQFSLPSHLTLFLTIFDFNSYLERKNPEGVIAAFCAALESDQSIGLVVKCHGLGQSKKERADFLRKVRNLPNIFIIDKVLPFEDIGNLYAACDALISLHRSEGFGLTIAEAMARGIPIISTNYSGVVDFIDDSVGALIDYELVKVPLGKYPGAESAVWAEPSTDCASKAILEFSTNPKRRIQLGQNGKNRVRELLSLFRTGRAMTTRLDEILCDLERKEIGDP